MAQEYWVKLTADGDEYGPYPGGEVRKYAAEGRLQPDSLVSVDRTVWHEARKIKGLFAATAAPALAAANQPASPAPASAAVRITPQMIAPEESAATETLGTAPALGYYTSSAGEQFLPVRRRNTLPFLITAILMCIAYCGIAVCAYAVADSITHHNPTPDMTKLALAGIFTLAFTIFAVPTLIFWLVWVHGTHTDLRRMSGGDYSISPGQAVGLSFIPLFDIAWAVYMPWRLAGEVNRQLKVRGLRPISSGGVMTCQIASVLIAPFFMGLTPIMYAISMRQVQGGLNRLLETPG